MKHNFPFFNKILVIYLIILQIVVVYQYLNPREILIENKPSLKENNNLISMLVEQENGEYQELKDTNWPGSEYVLNESLSGCENNSVLTWDKANKSIKVNAMGSDRCYVYFDIKKHYHETCQDDSATCKLAKTTLTDENLIYHQTNYLNKIGLVNKELNANDESYRYSGANPDNYVCLDGTTTEGNCATDSDLYRIIGLFKNDQDQYEMKLIKAVEGTTKELGDGTTAPGGSYRNGDINYYWNYTGSGIYNNMWQDSNLNKINLNDFYYKYITGKVANLGEHITKHEWITGGISNVSYNALQLYNKELGTEKLAVGSNNCYDADFNTGARACTEDDLSYKDAKIGLMYASDYGYAAYPEAWNQYVHDSGYGSEEVKANNWLFTGKHNWTISRSSNKGDYAIYAARTGGIGHISTYGVKDSFGIRPTFYLPQDTKLSVGNGTHDNPFRLSWN